MSENQACCAHSKVVLKHEDFPGGYRSDYWECDSGCGAKFYPAQTDQAGIRLRDWLAGMALQQLCAGAGARMVADRDERYNETNWKEVVAANAYEFADAMLQERMKPKP